MADDVALNPMSGGPVVATDEVSGTGEHVQVVKLAVATDGDRTPIPADSVYGLRVFGNNIGNPGSYGDAGIVLLADQGGAYSALNIGASGELYVAPIAPIDVMQSGSWSVNQAGTWNVTASGTVAATQSGSWQMRPVVGSAIAAGTVTVATTSTQILASSSTRKSVALTNNGTTNVWVGPSGLSLSTGLKIPPGATAVIDAAPAAAIYGIADTSSAAVAYFTESD